PACPPPSASRATAWRPDARCGSRTGRTPSPPASPAWPRTTRPGARSRARGAARWRKSTGGPRWARVCRRRSPPCSPGGPRMEPSHGQGEHDGDGATLVLWILLAVIAIQTLFPLLSVGLVTNDDLKLANAALDRGARGVASVLWSFTRRDGRLDLAQILSWYV